MPFWDAFTRQVGNDVQRDTFELRQDVKTYREDYFARAAGSCGLMDQAPPILRGSLGGLESRLAHPCLSTTEGVDGTVLQS